MSTRPAVAGSILSRYGCVGSPLGLVLTFSFSKAGFGWTNGVVLWIAANYGHVLTTPDCPDILEIIGSSGKTTTSGAPLGMSASATLVTTVVVAIMALLA